MELQTLSDGIFRIPGSVWAGLLVRDGHALLIDLPELPAGESLAGLLDAAGVRTVDQVLLTQHRRAHSGGLLQWDRALPPVAATPAEASLLARAGRVWSTSHGKYHRYDCIPDRFSPLSSIPAAGSVTDGAPIVWRGLTITPVTVGALSDGDCAYLVEDGRIRIAFCGALAMAGGRIHDLYSFQKALPHMMGYHGYLGGLPSWLDGIQRLLSLRPDLLSPSYGPVERDPAGCLSLLERRLRAYAEAYDRISAVRYYFPEEFRRGFEIPLGLTPPAQRAAPGVHPGWLSRIGETTSYLLRAPSGHAILIDAGDLEAVQAVQAMLADGRLQALDACWITHAHDDHLNAVWALVHAFDCELLTTAAVAEVCTQPSAWFLPALPDCSVKFRVCADGEAWDWEGFRLTAMHLPGQCVYHAGLLAERGHDRVLLCGDSFAPTGLDDYCADNRNLTGFGRGYRRCIALLRQYGVEQLVNEHQSEPFLYDEAFLQFLEDGMDRRDSLLAELLPDDPGLGTDSQWMRCWPMEQTATAGAPVRLSVQITGHGAHTIRIAPRLPWAAACRPVQTAVTTGLTSGSVLVGSDDMPADQWLHFDLRLPEGQAGEFRIPFDCWLDERYLGSYLVCTVRVLPG